MSRSPREMLIGRNIEVKDESFAPLANPSAEIKFASSEFRLSRLTGAQIRTPDPRIARGYKSGHRGICCRACA
jgi:hypothetical protein